MYIYFIIEKKKSIHLQPTKKKDIKNLIETISIYLNKI